MDSIENFAYAYSQTPWRKQLRIIGLFSLVLVIVAMIAILYLTVTAYTTAAGRDVQYYKYLLATGNLEIEDLESQLAILRSYDQMGARAEKLGFAPLTPEQIVYLNIPGFPAQQPVRLTSGMPRSVAPAHITPAEYSESLMTWMKRKLAGSSAWLEGINP